MQIEQKNIKHNFYFGRKTNGGAKRTEKKMATLKTWKPAFNTFNTHWKMK